MLKLLASFIRKVDSWARPENPWYLKLLNVLLTSGTHGAITAFFGLVPPLIGLAALDGHAAFAYVVFKETGPIVNRLVRGVSWKQAVPHGWAAVDSAMDALVPVVVSLLIP